MNLVDSYCLKVFPELEQRFGEDKLELASSYGSYIFHEDFLIPYIIAEGDPDKFTRLSEYIDYLASSRNDDLRDLAQLALIDNLVNLGFVQIAPYLTETGMKLVYQAQERLRFDLAEWTNTQSDGEESD